MPRENHHEERKCSLTCMQRDEKLKESMKPTEIETKVDLMALSTHHFFISINGYSNLE